MKKKKLKIRSKAIPKNKLYAKAFKLAERAMLEAIRRRDKVCQVHKEQFDECKSKVLVADHCISRSNKSTFFDERNLTLVCKGVNWGKFKGNKSLQEKVEEIVMNKWGTEILEELRILSRLPKKFSIQELEETKNNFNSIYL